MPDPLTVIEELRSPYYALSGDAQRVWNAALDAVKERLVSLSECEHEWRVSGDPDTTCVKCGSPWRADGEVTEAQVEALPHLVGLSAFAPRPHVLELARQVRFKIGHGGANFPGACEFYEAASKVEAWAAAYEAAKQESGRGD